MAKHVVPDNANADRTIAQIAPRIKDGDTVLVHSEQQRQSLARIMTSIGKSDVFYFVEVRKR